MYKPAAEETGYSEETCRKAKWVSSQYETGIRIPNLSFGHHRIVAALPIEERAAILADAEHEGWSVRELKAEIRQRKNRIGRQRIHVRVGMTYQRDSLLDRLGPDVSVAL